MQIADLSFLQWKSTRIFYQSAIFLCLIFGLSKVFKQTQEALIMAPLTVTVTATPTTGVRGSEILYTVTVTGAVDTHSAIQVTGFIPTHTQIIPNSVVYGSGRAATIANSSIPVWTIDTLSSSKPGAVNTVVSYRVLVNANANSPIVNTISVNSTNNGSPATTSVTLNTNLLTQVITAPSACTCNDDNSPNVNNGTYTVRLLLRNADNSALPAGLPFTLLSGTNISTLLGTQFLFDNGNYYLDVTATSASYTVNVDGPDLNANIDITFNGNCTGYPTITYPVPLQSQICVLPGAEVLIPISGILTLNFPVTAQSPPLLPAGFSYRVIAGQLNLVIEGDGIDPQQSPMQLYYYQFNVINPALLVATYNSMMNAADFQNFINTYLTNNCVIKSVNTVDVALSSVAVVNPTHFPCVAPGDPIYFEQILGAGNTSPEGTFSVTTLSGEALIQMDGDYFAPANGGCYEVTYTIINPKCGNVTSSPAKVYITVKPPKPEFTINDQSRPAPICATLDQMLTLSALGTGETYFIPLDDVSGSSISGTTLNLPAPPLPAEEGISTSIQYTICKTNQGPSLQVCTPPGDSSWNIPPVLCVDTLCKKIVLYNDGYNCGETALFESTCPEPFRPDICPVDAKPGLVIGCRWFQLSTPPIMSADIEFDEFSIQCQTEEISGSYLISFFGVSVGNSETETRLRDFPGIGTICRILNFEIFGIRPLGAIADLLGCNKTLIQFIVDLLGAIVGGDGSEVLVRADTDGDGSFDLTIINESFPAGGDFTIPNRVPGAGYISARALGSWPSGLPGECGNLENNEISLLDLLPIGSIPIVGPSIEDFLTFAGCDVWLEFSAAADAEVLVTASSPAAFANCDTTTRVLYTYTGQSTTCVLPTGLWSIPVAFSACTNEVLTYMGVVPLDSIEGAGVYQTSGPSPGSILIPGDTLVTFTAVSCNGNYSSCSFLLRVLEADPSFEAGFICCSEQSVFLGGAGWDGIGAPPIPNTIRLDAIRGRYPNTLGGRWTGSGVEFYNPDNIPFNGDEYYLFNPLGLDGSYTLTYTIDGQPCDITFSRDISVTCQDLQVSLTNQVTCPGAWVPERIIIINLDDDSITVTTSGLSNIGAAGGHYGGGPATDAVTELIDTIANDGKVVVPGFFAPALRDSTFTICVRTYQRNSPFGCEDVFCYDIRVVDTIAPVLLNCPTEPIIVDALLGQCEAFVNFPFPIAFDSCHGFTNVVQVDQTGLTSGDLFPVGLTVLAYSAIDSVGNQNYCEIKIVVQDFRLPPRMQCPANVVNKTNDLNECGAIVNNIAPLSLTDNCLTHVAVTYEITGPNGEQLACGFENASGNFFPVGTSTVKYRAQDQPLILITEVMQSDGSYGVEITNFGPAAVDITCGKFVLKDENGIAVETYTVPTDNNISTMFERPIFPPVVPVNWFVRTPNNILDVGETFTHVFDGDENGDGIVDVVNNYDRCNVRTYCFAFLDYVIDEAVVNDSIESLVILRNTICDTGLQSDFRAANACDTSSFGSLNLGFTTATFSNDTVGLQSLAPNFDMCSFTVSVEDLEAPSCIWHDSIRMARIVNLPLVSNLCLSDTVVMPAGLVDDINIFNLNITTPNAGAIGAYLRGPSGQRIKLFHRICGTDTLFCTVPPGIAGTADINVNLNQTINKWQPAPSITTAPCTPMGGGQTFSPEESFKKFYGQEGGGNWILEIYGEEGVTGTLVSWDLEILYQIPFGQMDTTLSNSPGLCDTVFTWIHPILEDNCMLGKMHVDYIFSNIVTGVSDTITAIIKDSMNTINMMGCVETRTFRVGTTEVRYTLTDNYGNVSMCSFRVIVNDTENPEYVALTCNDTQIFLTPGLCTGVLINPPQATDNCVMFTITYCFVKADGTDSIPANINELPIGMYDIVAKATDIYGNIQRCIFQVVVLEFIPPTISLACINNVNLSLDATCIAEVTPSMILSDANSLRCYDNYGIVVLDNMGNPRSPIFTKADEGKSFKVIVLDDQPPRVAPFNSCWGYIHIERKLGPTMLCARDTTVFCNTDANAKTAQGKYVLGEPMLTSCENKVTVWHQDDWVSYGNCDSIRALLIRTWYLENDKGERISCVQNVKFRRMSLDSIVYPLDITNLSCVDVERNPSLLLPDNTGHPSLHGMKVNRIGGLCMVSLLYTDEKFEICYGSYEILRTWKLRDMCGPVTSTNPRTHVQIIKVNSNDGPIINDCPQDITVSVDAWECLYNGELPVPKDVDGVCSPHYTFQARIIGGGRVFSSIDGAQKLSARASNLRKGTYTIIYDFKDQCLKKSQCSFNITVVDYIAPVAIAKEFITVSLTKNNANLSESGVATLFVHQVDNGSYDNCGPVYMEVRRDDDAPACTNLGDPWNHDNNASTQMIPWNNNRTYNGAFNGLDQNVGIHPTFDNINDTDKGQYVKFCCEDLGKDIKVWLRVWDDASGDGIFGNAGDNFNETWANVKVEDKIVPKIFCIPEVEIACDRDTSILAGYNFTEHFVDVAGKVKPELLPTVDGICHGYELEFKDEGSLSVCNSGTFKRIYRVKGFPSVSCIQLINVKNVDAKPTLEWPIVLHEWNNCTLTEEDVALNTVRARLNIERETYNAGCFAKVRSDQDQIACNSGDFDDLCKDGTNEDRWEDPSKPYNILAANVSCGAYLGGRPGPLSTNGTTPSGLPRFNSNYKDPGCNVYGQKLTIEEYQVGEGCKKWVVKWNYINWCCNEESACRTTIFKYVDNTAPIITECQRVDAELDDQTCLASVLLSPKATDAGVCETALTWRIRIYLNDSTATGAYQERSTLAPSSQTKLSGSNPTLNLTGTWALPAGVHGVKYIVTDGCGNVRECINKIVVWPKAATPYCVPLSSAVMKNGLVELWARDFDKGSYTNCGIGVMLFTFDKLGIAEHPHHASITLEHYFRGYGELLAIPGVSSATTLNNAIALYNEGKAQKWLPDVERKARPSLPNGDVDPRGDLLILKGGTSGKQFGCKAGDAIGTAIEIPMRVWDYRSFESGKTNGSDFCKSSLTLVDNQGGCGAQSLIVIAGNIATESSKPMHNVEVSLNALLPEYPIKTITEASGKYLFNNQPIGLEYSMTPSVIADVTDGINTLDLIHIQRHILGLAKLKSPYKMIAADVDGDEAIRVNDLISIRKLILGVNTNLPLDKSWSFVSAHDNMDVSPWPFNELISHAQLQEASIDNDFIGIKLGDVDASASYGNIRSTTQTRRSPLVLSYDDFAVQTGKEYELNLFSPNFEDIHGMQWTMGHKGLKISEINGRSIQLNDENTASHTEDVSTFSWAAISAETIAKEDVVLRIKFVAKVDGNVSDMLKMTNDITAIEAYMGNEMEIVKIDLVERKSANSIFALTQNEPNPWREQTKVSYSLPAPGVARFTFFDVTGRLIMEKNLPSVEGPNVFTISRSDMKGITGMILYKLEFEGQTSQRKMLLFD